MSVPLGQSPEAEKHRGGLVKVGVQVLSDRGKVDAMRDAWVSVDGLGADYLFTDDHLLPQGEKSEAKRLESWALISAMAACTLVCRIGPLVSSAVNYHPARLVRMAHTVNHISNGRLVIGMGAGWRDDECVLLGMAVPSTAQRVDALARTLDHLEQYSADIDDQIPAPWVLVGGNGKMITLKLAARYAHVWNGAGSPLAMAALNRSLDKWCVHFGRDPRSIERSVMLPPQFIEPLLTAHLMFGVTTFVTTIQAPNFALGEVEKLLAWRDSVNAIDGLLDRSFLMTKP